MPFGLRANIAAGLASLLSLLGAVVMLGAGARNHLVRWSAAQAIVLWCTWFAFWVLFALVGLARAGAPRWPYVVLDVAVVAGWIFASAGAFMGKAVRIPILAPLTRLLFGSLLESPSNSRRPP